MRRARFIPARDPRHRSAVLALYRTLLRQGQRVPLLELETTQSFPNPISYHIRRRFAANQSCNSLRLVYAALTAGYKSVGFLSRARTPSSPEHSQLLAHLRKHPVPPPPPQPRQIHTEREGLMRKVIGPDGTHRYVPNEPPSEDPSWATRRVPLMGRTAENDTFLRLRKPQPTFLSRKLNKYRAISVREVEKSKSVESELLPIAAGEDLWERTIGQQASREGLQWTYDDEEASYRYCTAISTLWYLWKWERRLYDLNARGAANQAYIDEIRQMQMDQIHGYGPGQPAGESRRGPTRERLKSDVRVLPAEKAYPLTATVLRIHGQLPSGTRVDPFTAPFWSTLVERRADKIARAVPPLRGVR